MYTMEDNLKHAIVFWAPIQATCLLNVSVTSASVYNWYPILNIWITSSQLLVVPFLGRKHDSISMGDTGKDDCMYEWVMCSLCMSLATPLDIIIRQMEHSWGSMLLFNFA